MRGQRLATRHKATCKPGHRGRWAVQGDNCADCVARAPAMVMEDGPTPAACPHCHNDGPAWFGDEYARRCFTCGQRWERRIQAAYL